MPKPCGFNGLLTLILAGGLALTFSCCHGGSSDPAAADESSPPGPLRLKAEAHDRWLEQWHTPNYGSHLHVKFTDETRTEVERYHGHGDSCIWTGTYVTSQANRYRVTGDPQALDNVVRSVSALSRHLHVTGREGFIARYVGPADDPGHAGELAGCEEDENCHRLESGPYAGDFWKGNTSRDQYTGWFMAMAFAYDVIRDEELRSRIAADVTEVLDRLIADRWWIIDVDGQATTKAPSVLSTMQMTWALVGYHVSGEERFLQIFLDWAVPEKQTQLKLSNIAFLNRYAQHYGLNLAHSNFLNLLRLSRDYPEAHDFLVSLFREQTHSVVDLQHNPWYTAVYLAVGDITDPEVIREHKDQVILDLTDFPGAPKVRYAMEPPPARLDPFSVWLYELQQELPWLSEIMGTVRPQAAEAYRVKYHCSSGFIFQRNMWAICCSGEDDPSYVNSGHDYLAAYWLASAFGILEKSL